MDILFLGNSLIFYNDLPTIFETLTKSAGKDVKVDSVTKGSATISDFAHSGTASGSRAYQKLKNQKWDYVVIEPSRRINPYENTVLEAERKSAQTIQQLAKHAGAQILLYSVWGNNNGTVIEYKAITPIRTEKVASHSLERRAHTKFMHNVNLQISEALGGVKIAPAGYAFENSISAMPDLNLYAADLRHPSLEGSYLAACTIFCTMFGERTEALTYTADASSSDQLRKIADSTVFEKRLFT